MDKKDGLCHREVIERYCNVIDENTPIFLICERESVRYRCLRLIECTKEIGGCRNLKYREK